MSAVRDYRPMESLSSSARSPEDELIFEKSAKVKQWVKNRMKELEDQNERLRLQNLRCTTQLQMLRSFTEKSKQLKAEMAMSRSITGTLPVMRDTENRTSDDSGLTSDDTSERRQLGASVIETSTPRQQRKPVRLRKDSVELEKGSSTSDSSPWEEKAKPIPVPRKLTGNNNFMERDSLNSYADDYEFDVEDEIFDEISSPADREGNIRYNGYVNLSDFVAIRDEGSTYSDIMKTAVERPALPEHKPKAWESRLLHLASECLSVSDCGDCGDLPCTSTNSPNHPNSNNTTATDSPTSRRSCGSKLSARSSPRTHSFSSASPVISEGLCFAVKDLSIDKPSDDGYYTPPDASRHSGDIRTSLIPSFDTVEKSGYWNQMSDSRLKSLKRRFVVLKNNQLSFYRTAKTNAKGEDPLMKIVVSDIISVAKICQQGSTYAFQLVTQSAKYQFMTESERTTHEWVTTLNAVIKGSTLRDLATRCAPVEASISGWMTRVRCGHSKRVYASLVRHKLMFFKNAEDTVPCGFTQLKGARVMDKQKMSSDEYSGSSDEQNPDKNSQSGKKDSYSLSIEMANEDPLYIVLRSSEEKEKWLYFLRAASGDATLCGSPFAILVQRMLAEGGEPDSPLWNDLLLTSCDDTPKDTLMEYEGTDKKKALEIAKATYLFVSVLMRPIAAQYHIDLAQNILSTAMQHEFLRNEVYAQLIKLTSGSMPFSIQGWKLLAMAIPLFVPTQYSLLWLLKKHVARWCMKTGDESNMAEYCQCALERVLRVGCREAGPSRLETTSVLTRDPTSTKFPHSISVRLPNGQYQVVEFDGSTEIGQCLSSLCLKLGIRPALLSGYALYIDDPTTKGLQLLKGKQKLCDCLYEWEVRLRDVLRGKISPDCTATLSLRMRHYWRHLICNETPMERSLLVWRMAEELVDSRIPTSPQLAEQLAALYAQLSFGDAPPQAISDEQFTFITKQFFPAKMLDVACLKSLRSSLHSSWSELSGMSEADAIKFILQVLRQWPLFGCHLQAAGMRTSNERKVYLALSDTAVHVIDHRHFDVIRSFPYNRLASFGGFHNDFMLTAERTLLPDSHPEETTRERITFSMEKHEVEQLTLHLAEYIRCQKLVWKVSK
uniref:PH domain-containing protein n=1 Tax=Haemonchus contortus TaxID=6289 RepID=A0A7I5ECQ7_HAECO